MYYYLKKSTHVTNTPFLPQRHFSDLVKPTVDRLRWEDTGDHLQRWTIFIFFLLVLLMDSKNT